MTNTLTRSVIVTDIRFYTTYGAPAFSHLYRWFTLPPGASNTIWVKFSPKHNIYHKLRAGDRERRITWFPHVDPGRTGPYSMPTTIPLRTNQRKRQDGHQVDHHERFDSSWVTTSLRDSMFMLIDNQRRNGQGATQNTPRERLYRQPPFGYTDRTDAQTNYGFNTEHTFRRLISERRADETDLHHLFRDDLSNNQRGNNPFAGSNPHPPGPMAVPRPMVCFEPRDAQRTLHARCSASRCVTRITTLLTSQRMSCATGTRPFRLMRSTAHATKRSSPCSANRNPFIDYPQFIDRITLHQHAFQLLL